MKLDEARNHVGSGVVYRFGRQFEQYGLAWPAEDGVITSVNNYYVFVRFAGDQHSKAVRPEDLELLCYDS